MKSQSIDLIDKKFQKELNAGIVSLVLLSVLSRSAWFDVWLSDCQAGGRERHGGNLIKLGTLYPVLRALEDIRIVVE